MVLSLDTNHVASVKVMDGEKEAIVVQFSKDSFGNIQVEAWGQGCPRLFSLTVPSGGVPEVEHLAAV